jgi:hypothetical protein
MSMHPSFQFSVVAYDADLVITVQDHDRPAVLVTTLQADPWISGESWYVDVTETVKQRLENGANTGFRFQLTDEARTIETSTGTGFSIYAPFGSYLLIEVVSP